MTMRRYQAYGLIVESQIELSELTPAPDTGLAADVRIMLAAVPEHLQTVVGSGVLYEASANEFLLKMPKISRYLVRNGSEILVEPAPEATDSDVRVFMLGSCVGALLHQREMLVLHAAAVGAPSGAVLFAGPSGVGKSTLLGEMLNRGYSMMVDDVCAVVPDGSGGVQAVPGYPRTRLWADSARRLDVETVGLDRTRASLEKFERQLPEAFWNEPAPIRRLYVLSAHNTDEFVIKPLDRVQAFGAVLHNTYRRQFLEGLEMQAPHFALASAMAASVRVTRIVRPGDGFDLTALADMIESDLAEENVGEENLTSDGTAEGEAVPA